MSRSNVAQKLPTSGSLPAVGVTEREHLLRLVAEHRKRKYEPLHLAVHFVHPKHKKDLSP
jgi:hypothetical protein